MKIKLRLKTMTTKQLQLIHSIERLINQRYAAAASAIALMIEPRIFHALDVSQSSVVLFPLESLLSYLFSQVSLRSSTSFSMITSTGGLYLLPYSSLYQLLSEPVSLLNSSTLTTTAPEQELEMHTFSLSSHTPP